MDLDMIMSVILMKANNAIIFTQLKSLKLNKHFFSHAFVLTFFRISILDNQL